MLKTMINTEALKKKILDLAIHGKLVPQDPNDEPAEKLLKRIKSERDKLIDEGKIKGKKDDFSYIYKGDDNRYYEKLKNRIVDISENIPFDLPRNWAWSRIGSYVLKVTDFVASGSFNSLRKNVTYYKSKNYALMVKTQDFQNNFSADLTWTDEASYRFLENSNLFGGELILSNVGSVGNVYIVPKLNFPMTLAPNSIMIRLFDNRLIQYLYFIFLSSFGRQALISITSATAVSKFNKTDFKTLLIPIPPAEEQVKIIHQLKKYIDLVDNIEKNQVLINKLKEQVKRKIIKLGLVGKLLKGDDNSYYEKSKNNLYDKLENQVQILDCYRKPINSSEREKRLQNSNKRYPYYGATGKAGEIDQYLLDGQFVLIGEDCAPFLDKYKDKAYIIEGKSWVNNHAHILKSISNKFLMYYLNAFDYQQYVSGTTRLKLTQKDLKRIPYPILDKALQEKIAESIDRYLSILDKF